MTAPRRRSEVRDGFRFTLRADSSWTVETLAGVHLGTARANGSRLRSRSWTYRLPNREEGRTNSRRSAAAALFRASRREVQS